MSDTLPRLEEELYRLDKYGGRIADIVLSRREEQDQSLFSRIGDTALLDSVDIDEFNLEIGLVIDAEEYSHRPGKGDIGEWMFQHSNKEVDRHMTYDQWEEYVNFFRKAFDEALTIEPGRTIHGPLYRDIDDLLGRSHQLLELIYPNASQEVFYPKGYQSVEARAMIGNIWNYRPNAYYMIKKLVAARREALADLTDSRMPELTKHKIDSGLLKEPEFLWQYADRACVSTSFLMVMEDIYQDSLYYRSFEEGRYLTHKSSIVDDKEYLNVMKTEFFKSRFGKEPQCVSFVGASLETINKFAEGVKKRFLGNNVYCIITLLSDSFPEAMRGGIWHSNVLLSADDEYVTVHDPSLHRGGPNRKIQKEKFLHRWAQAHNRGHLIVASR